jgi:hypothetical protein
VGDAEIDEQFLRAQADRYRAGHRYSTPRAAQLASGNDDDAAAGGTTPAGASPPESLARGHESGSAQGLRMAEHDPRAFQDLFDSEPARPSAVETARWIDLYERLTALMERQLEETRQFAESVPDPMKRYLRSENVPILTEELEIFRRRLAHWREAAGTQATPPPNRPS